MSYEVKYFILKKGERLRVWGVKPSPINGGGVETIIGTYCNVNEDIKIEIKDLGSEKALNIIVGSSLIIFYCTRFEVKGE